MWTTTSYNIVESVDVHVDILFYDRNQKYIMVSYLQKV